MAERGRQKRKKAIKLIAEKKGKKKRGARIFGQSPGGERREEGTQLLEKKRKGGSACQSLKVGSRQ